MKPLRECFEGILRFDLSVGFRELQSRSNTAGYLAERKAFFTRAKPSVPSCPPTLSRSQKHTGTHAHFKFPLHSESLSLTHLFTHSPVLLPRERAICPVLLSCFSSFTNFLRLNISLTLFLLTSGWSTNQTLWSYVQSLQAVTHSLSLRSSLSLSLSLSLRFAVFPLARLHGEEGSRRYPSPRSGPGSEHTGHVCQGSCTNASRRRQRCSIAWACVGAPHARARGQLLFPSPCPSPSLSVCTVHAIIRLGLPVPFLRPVGGGKKCNSTSYDQTSAVK